MKLREKERERVKKYISLFTHRSIRCYAHAHIAQYFYVKRENDMAAL